MSKTNYEQRQQEQADRLRHYVIDLVADMWAHRVPQEEAKRILGYDTAEWSWQERVQALYDWKYTMLAGFHDSEQLVNCLRLEQEYIKYTAELAINEEAKGSYNERN